MNGKTHGIVGQRVFALLVGCMVVTDILAADAIVKAAMPVQACSTSDNEFSRAASAAKAFVIVGRAGDHVRLYRKHPGECAGNDLRACEGKAYLIPGDRVEAASTCGGYVHVRYVGQSRTSVGWVERTALREVGAVAAVPGRGDDAHPSSDILADVEGYYTSTGHCWTYDGPGNSPLPCGSLPDTCMIIKRIDASHAALSIESVQGNGHDCGTSGVADLRGKELIYVQTNKHDADDGNGITIDLNGPELKLDYIRGALGRSEQPFCAINANLQGIAFKKSDREAIAGRTCGD